ncbi:uncharacterized protein LOC134210762 [Armigeres subalbatus]|uniref:uncharacterized protein LOC134210762 n=1 Tax=Armigeres subalbatus TaxID=124917 RepID=UPI002ED5444B
MSEISAIVSISPDHNIDQEKSNPLHIPSNNDAPTKEAAKSLFNWKALTTFRTTFKIGEIISAIVILVFVLSKRRIYYRDPLGTPLEISYIFLAINSLIGTVLLLGNSIIEAQPLGRAFTSVLWFRVELWFNGLTAVIYYTWGYCVLMSGFLNYEIGNNHLAAYFGFFAALLHLVDWWMSFSKRHATIRKLENEKDDAAEKENFV